MKFSIEYDEEGKKYIEGIDNHNMQNVVDILNNKLKKCKTCKFWVKEESYLLSDNQAVCKSDKISEEEYNEQHKDKSDMLIYQFSENGIFYTGENFGCIHHEESKI